MSWTLKGLVTRLDLADATIDRFTCKLRCVRVPTLAVCARWLSFGVRIVMSAGDRVSMGLTTVGASSSLVEASV